MAFAGISVITDGKLCDCDSTLSTVDAGAYRGYHLLVVRGYSRARVTALPDRDCILSSPFIVGGHRWHLEFYPGAYDDEKNEAFISVFLVLDDLSDTESVEARFVFSFIDQPELGASMTNRQSQLFTKYDNAHGEEFFARTEVLERSRHVKNDSFTIRCDVAVVVQNSTKEMKGAGTNGSDFGNLLLSRESADITLEVDGQKFAAHRCVLAARSAVFKAQLFADMDVGATVPSVVKIEGINADVFEGLLIFMYTGAMPDINSSTREDDKAKKGEVQTAWLLQLLEASDQYNLQRLKLICVEILADRYISAASVADIVGVAERRRCLWLKEECMEFIRSHTKLPSVFTPVGLDKIISNCSPSVLKELLSKFSS